MSASSAMPIAMPIVSIESVASIASDVSDTSDVSNTCDYEGVKLWLQSQDGVSLLNVQKEIIKMLEKHLKVQKKKVEKKKGSFPKGVSPPQLERPRAWVTFTLEDAVKNGWEKFEMKETKKMDGEKVEEYVTMPCSMMHEGEYVFDDSVTEKTPNGKKFTQKHAMALSKQRWSVKEKVGTHQEKYEEFLEEYEDKVENDEKVEKVEKVVKVKITAEDKEMEQKKKEIEKELLKAQKEEKKREEKEAKELLKAQEKAKKDKKVVKADKDELKKKKVEKVEKVEKWSCPDDGKCHPWVFKGQKLFRNYENEVYKSTPSGPKWVGVYMEAEDKIDDSVEDPNMSEDEE